MDFDFFEDATGQLLGDSQSLNEARSIRADGFLGAVVEFGLISTIRHLFACAIAFRLWSVGGNWLKFEPMEAKRFARKHSGKARPVSWVTYTLASDCSLM